MRNLVVLIVMAGIFGCTSDPSTHAVIRAGLLPVSKIDQPAENEARVQFYLAYVNGKTATVFEKPRERQSSISLRTVDGRVYELRDYSRDPQSNRGVYTTEVSEVKFGYWIAQDRRFIECDPKTLPNDSRALIWYTLQNDYRDHYF